MKQSKIIQFNGQDVTVKELTVEEIDRIFNSGAVPDILDLVFPDSVPVIAVEAASGLNREVLHPFAPSMLAPLWEAVEAVNPFFVAALNRLSGLGKGLPTGMSS
jgi:hypothetical protein